MILRWGCCCISGRQITRLSVPIPQHFQPLLHRLDRNECDPRDIAARAIEAGYQAQFDWIAADQKYDGDR